MEFLAYHAPKLRIVVIEGQPIMRRRLFKLCLFLLLGAIINVAVAWGFSGGTPFDTTNLSPLSADDAAAIEERYAPPHWCGRSVSSWVPSNPTSGYTNTTSGVVTFVLDGRQDAFALSIDHVAGVREIDPGTTTFRLIESFRFEEIQRMRAGWPLRSFETGASTGYTRPPTIRPTHAWVMTVGPGDLRWIPYRPIWPGFAINTIFYATILWLPFAGFRFVRRRIRARRGLCPACAYPIGTSDVCTECGKAVK